MNMEYGHLAGALTKASEKSGKPLLDVSARLSIGSPLSDKSYLKKELVRLRKEIKATSDMVSNWDAEDVAARALKSLKTDMAVKKARLMEIEAQLGDDGIGEEGADDEDEGSVVAGPYEILSKGEKYVVRNMETGHTKGIHASRRKALRQLRLLEGIEHGWRPTGGK
jgi:hypothetical protein